MQVTKVPCNDYNSDSTMTMEQRKYLLNQQEFEFELGVHAKIEEVATQANLISEKWSLSEAKG